MYLKSLELVGFKSFNKKSSLEFSTPITAIVGPNGSGKSNAAEAFRFVLGEQSIKSLRGKRGEDLIWGGSTTLPRSNRASVKAVFDNRKRLLDIDFDEVAIERVVYRDGNNEYLINGSKVRLKDVIELLAGANVGSSGHHIIAQGEADRVLSASPRERKHMVEDALGLRIYQYKKEESTKKLEKTEENTAQVEALRRENAPHLKFLERQVKKLERARALREELIEAYGVYLKNEETHLSLEREAVKGLRDEPTKELRETDDRIRDIRTTLEKSKEGDKQSGEILALEKNMSTIRSELAEHTRSAGRIEGQLAFEERRIEDEKRRAKHNEGQPIPYKEAREFWDKLTRTLDFGHAEESSLGDLKDVLKDAQALLRKFVEHHVVHEDTFEPDTKELDRLTLEKTEAESAMERIQLRIVELETQLRNLNQEIEKGKDDNRDLERELFTCMSTQTQIRATLTTVDAREIALDREEQEFKREIGEGVALIGRLVMQYKDLESPGGEVVNIDEDSEEVRTAQYERKRALEKMKIRFEEMGGASADDITKEHQEVKERDEFLEHELDDLVQSAESLRNLIANLDKELSEKFRQGVADVDKQFNEFFALMFGGGGAHLKIVRQKKRRSLVASLLGTESEIEEEDEEESTDEEGIEIEVSLPKKKVQSLMMLSGGERALTSIALIFAMSQVNPPPFIILDETDAALDEANSRRYGDMIATLANKSQLILITHNRETMSRAGVLYGITMSIDGASRILSVRFEEAVAVAK